MLEFYFIIAFTLFLQALPVEAGEYCQYINRLYYTSRYCDFGCCGSQYSSYSDACCVQNLASIIAGSVIGGLVGLAILIGLIVCCCVLANNSSRRTGTVNQPANTTPHTLVVNNTAFAQGPSTNPGPFRPVGYGYPGDYRPPAYAQYNNVPPGGTGTYPPPAYAQYNNVPPGSTDPAFPPPPAAKY